MLTRSDFNAQLEALISKYPELSARRQAGDPMLTQHMDAIFTAFSMLSANQEVALAEPHAKTRPATVLADAALRGIIPKATAATISVLVRNEGGLAYTIPAGRTILDTAGRSYKAIHPATVLSNTTADVKFVQVRTESLDHRVVNASEFYGARIPGPDDNSQLASLRVYHPDGDEMTYKNDYIDVYAGERAYHVEVNADREVFVRFGDGTTVGYLVQADEVFRIEADYCVGEVTLSVAEPFEFEYTLSESDSMLSMELASVDVKGAAAPSIDQLRQLCKYPTIYDDDAVFLGEFDFLLRKHFPDADFLSVWNEAVEEKHRGYKLSNTNSIFIACVDKEGTEAIVGSDDLGVPLIGWGETTGTIEVVDSGVWGHRGARSVVGHSSGKHIVRMTFPNATGDIDKSNFYFGIATEETTLLDRPTDPDTGAMALFVNRHGGSGSQTGVLSMWHEDGLSSPNFNITPDDDLSYDDEYFIELDATANNAVFYVLREGVQIWSIRVNLPANKTWYIHHYNANSIGNNAQLMLDVDYVSDPGASSGFKAWDDIESNGQVRILSEAEFTPFQRAIAQRIKRADDTLRARFYTTKLELIPIHISVQIPSSYVPGEISNAIKELLISHYGRNSDFARNGGVIKTKDAIDRLVDGVAALRAQSADINLVIDAPDGSASPEVWRFVSEESIFVSVTVATGRKNGW